MYISTVGKIAGTSRPRAPLTKIVDCTRTLLLIHPALKSPISRSVRPDAFGTQHLKHNIGALMHGTEPPAFNSTPELLSLEYRPYLASELHLVVCIVRRLEAGEAPGGATARLRSSVPTTSLNRRGTYLVLDNTIPSSASTCSLPPILQQSSF